MDRPDKPHRRRIRKIDWTEVLRHLETAPVGTPFLIGRMHRSVATQINKGKYLYISPDRYRAWSTEREGETSNIWIARRP